MTRPSEPTAYPSSIPCCVALFRAPLRSLRWMCMNARHPNGCNLSKSGLLPYSKVMGAALSGLAMLAKWQVVTVVCMAASPQNGRGECDHTILVRIRLCSELRAPSACGFCCEARAPVRWWYHTRLLFASKSVNARGKSGPLSVSHVSIAVSSSLASR